MKKAWTFFGVLILTLVVTGHCFAGETHIGRALGESVQASSHASMSAAHSVAASGQVVSAASAVPFAIVGSVGTVSTEVAKELINAATAPAGCALPITEEIITAGSPPDEALKTKADSKQNKKGERP